MPKYIVNLWMDGYDTEEIMASACEEFIYEQLDITASSVSLYEITEDEENVLLYYREQCRENEIFNKERKNE
jgi:hypothetical protein